MYASLVALETTMALSTSSTTIAASTPSVTLSQSAIGALSVRGLGPRAFLRGEAELVGPFGERLDDQGDVLVLIDAELLDSPLHLFPVDRGREGRLLELLLHRLRLHPLDPGGPDECAGGDETGELIDRVERLSHSRLARHAHEFGMTRHRIDHLLRIAALLELLDRVPRMAGVEVRIALVVEIVDQAGDGVELFVLVP